MSVNQSASDEPIVSHDRVCRTFQGILRAAQTSGWTDESLAAASGVKARAIKSYRVEGKEPSVSAAMSLAVVIGPKALNPMLAIIGYVAQPLDEADSASPAFVAAEAMCHLGTFAKCAADNRIDHVEEPISESAADNVIELLTPYSSRGKAA